MKLTLKEEFCLRRLSENEFCSYKLSLMAEKAGNNRTVCASEWADAPLRRLRKLGLIEKTKMKSDCLRYLYRITDTGRALIEEMAT